MPCLVVFVLGTSTRTDPGFLYFGLMLSEGEGGGMWCWPTSIVLKRSAISSKQMDIFNCIRGGGRDGRS